MSIDKVVVVGLGYIGLPTAAVIASRGIKVLGVDVSAKVISTINKGEIHIVEPDLDIAVRSVVTTGMLTASDKAEAADYFVIAVPTPFKEQHQPDLSYIESAAQMIAPHLEKGNVVILESTSPVGATEKLSEWLAKARPDLSFPHNTGSSSDIRVAHCPERVLPGYVMQELISNDRVIGGITSKCAESARELYLSFVRGECVLTTASTAELSKLAENAYRDVNIAYANELSIIADKHRINPWELIRMANRHPRVNILSPGPGVGGHCIAVDPWFIVASAPNEARLIRTAREVNDAKPGHVLAQIKDAADQFKKPVIACLGLAFKADIDDLRESPALAITKAVAASGYGELLVVEPNISELPAELESAELVSIEQALQRANLVVTLVDHRQFKETPANQLASKVVIDTRGIWQ